MKVTWSPRALARVDQAREYLAEERPLAAANWLDQLWERLELLSELPLQGRIVPEWNKPHVREILHHPYRIVYQVHPDRIEILTLHHVREEIDLR